MKLPSMILKMIRDLPSPIHSGDVRKVVREAIEYERGRCGYIHGYTIVGGVRIFPLMTMQAEKRKKKK